MPSVSPIQTSQSLNPSQQQMPGFQVEPAFVSLAMWGQGEVSVEAGGDRGGEDVPEVERDDGGGHEIDLVLREAFDLL
jgi:hypothetical protein